MGAKKKNNSKKKQKQPQRAQEVQQIENSGTAPEIVPHVEPEVGPEPASVPAPPQLEVNVLDQIDWKEIEQDELQPGKVASKSPITELSELSNAIDESDPDEQGLELVHEIEVLPPPISEVNEPVDETEGVTGSLTPPIDNAHLEDPIVEGGFFDQLSDDATDEIASVKNSVSHHTEPTETHRPSPQAQVESSIKSLAREPTLEIPAQSRQSQETEVIDHENQSTLDDNQVEQQQPERLLKTSEEGSVEKYSAALESSTKEPELKEPLEEPLEDNRAVKETQQDSASGDDVFPQIEDEQTQNEPKSPPLKVEEAKDESIQVEPIPAEAEETYEAETNFFDEIDEEGVPEFNEVLAKEQVENQNWEAAGEENIFDKVSEPEGDDFFENISSPGKKALHLDQAPEEPKPNELRPAASTLNLNFDDDDDFLESDEEPEAVSIPQAAATSTTNTAPSTLAFLEADDDLLSDEEEEAPYATTMPALSQTRTIRPTQSLHFDTGKRGFDLPTELMSKTKVQSRRAPEIIRPPIQPQPQLPKTVQYAPSASAPPGPMMAPKTPINPYAALPSKSSKQSVTVKPAVPNVPEHILPQAGTGTMPSTGAIANPYAAAQQPSTAKASIYTPQSVPTAHAFPYAVGPNQNTAQLPTKPAIAGQAPSLSGPQGGAPPKKNAQKYQRSADKDPYGFPELKKTATAPRSRSTINRAQDMNTDLPAPNVTDFNVSYQQQRAQNNGLLQNDSSVSYQASPSSAPYQAAYQAGASVNESFGTSEDYMAERNTFEKHSMAPSSVFPIGPPRANPYAPSAPTSGRTTPLKPPAGLNSPRKGSIQSTPSESPQAELHLSRPPSELSQYAPASIPQGPVPIHPAHASKQTFSRSSSTSANAPVVHNPSNASALDDRLRRQIPVFSWSKESVVSAVPPVISYGQNMGTTISITSTKLLALISETEAKYPGPLVNAKGAIKNKKKEVEKWTTDMASNAQEHQLLWSLMAIFVKELPQERESEEIQKILDPTAAANVKSSQLKSAADLFEAGKKISSHSRQGSTQLQGIFEQIQHGSRDSALQTAIESREWAHALILAYSEGDGAWDSVVKEFVRIELRSQGTPSSQQLAFAYRVFAGSGANSVDELRPLRSTTGSDAAHSLEANLANWKSYVAVIMANRSKNDVQALARLGELLVDNGQVEAGHFCFILSGAVTFGSDSMPALGVVSASGHNLSSMLLSEVYEYLLLTRKSISLPLPHLVICKAALGGVLADCGYISEGSKLSEAALVLARALRTPEILQLCEKINQRCTADAGAGWISRKLSRPRLDKMFGTSFNKFVSGEDTIEEEQPQQVPQPPQQPYRPASAGPYGQSHSSYVPSPVMPSFNESRSSTPGVYDHYRVASPKAPAQPSGSFDMHSNFAPQGQYGMPQQHQPPSNMQTYGHPGQYSTPGTPSPYIQQQLQTPTYAPQSQEPMPHPAQPPQGYTAPYNSYAPSAGPGASYAPPNEYASQYGASQSNQYAPPAPQSQVEPEPVKEEPKQDAKKKEDKQKNSKKEDKGDKKGWFGGWFGKGEEKDGKAIKAKLDSGSSFYYDETLGKWVNKDGPPPEETKPVAPPPKMKQPSAAPPAVAPPGSIRPPVTAPMSGPGSVSGPPKETKAPGTTQSDASNGPPVSSTTAPLPRAKARGNIDALLDGPATSGTRKKRNARNRYVDVTQQ